MRKIKLVSFVLLILCFSAAQDAQRTSSDQEQQGGYRIDQPGTITFTVGVKIKGKVEKPQVMIFLPKEQSWHREINFDHSFKADILEPLHFTPINE